MIIGMDNVQGLLRGANLTPYDENLAPLERVVEFDTETFLCRMASGGAQVAAGYVVVCGDAWQLSYLLNNAPRAMVPFIFPKLLRDSDPDAVDAFMRQYVDHFSAIHEAGDISASNRAVDSGLPDAE